MQRQGARTPSAKAAAARSGGDENAGVDLPARGPASARKPLRALNVGPQSVVTSPCWKELPVPAKPATSPQAPKPPAVPKAVAAVVRRPAPRLRLRAPRAGASVRAPCPRAAVGALPRCS